MGERREESRNGRECWMEGKENWKQINNGRKGFKEDAGRTEIEEWKRMQDLRRKRNGRG